MKKIRGQANKENVMVAAYYRLPHQEDAAKKFLLQLQEASCLQAPILLGDFSHSEMMHFYLLYKTLSLFTS